MTYSKHLLSGSAFGKQIKVTSTTSAASVVVHTAITDSTGLALDEIYIYAYNDDTAVRLLTILWGGGAEPDNVIRIPLQPRSGRFLVCDGMLLNDELTIRAYADAANMVILDGFVNRIS